MTVEHEMLRETELRELIDKFAKQISINSDLQLGIYNPDREFKNWKVNTKFGTIISLCSL